MVLRRVEGTKHGFILKPENTQDDWKETQGLYNKINCIICNKTTAMKHFHIHYLGNSIITINNSIPEDIVFINHKFQDMKNKETSEQNHQSLFIFF